MAVASRKSGKYIDISRKKKLSELTLEEVKKIREIVDAFALSSRVSPVNSDRYTIQSFSFYIFNYWMESLKEDGEFNADNMLTVGEFKIMHDACKWATTKNGYHDAGEFLKFLQGYFSKIRSRSANKEKTLDDFSYQSIYRLGWW